jgi:drug/metabolite transporter (DMT)-like permease
LTSLALAMVLTAAFLHAYWNYQTKRAGGGNAFLWLLSVCSAVIYCPLAILIHYDEMLSMDLIQWGFVAGSAAIHVLYFITLQRGYQAGDLSLIYPLARGTGPTLSTIASIVILAENPTVPALFGAGLVIFGVLLLSRGKAGPKTGDIKMSVFFGMLTGCFIATYTIWDKYAVSRLMVAPLVMEGFSFIFRMALFTPLALKNPAAIKNVWQKNRREVLLVATVSPLAYILVLIAMTFTPVSYVAPLREVSVLFAVLLGSLLLKEGGIKPRLLAAGIIAAGVILMATN